MIADPVLRPNQNAANIADVLVHTRSVCWQHCCDGAGFITINISIETSMFLNLIITTNCMTTHHVSALDHGC